MNYLKHFSFSPYVPWRLLGILCIYGLFVIVASSLVAAANPFQGLPFPAGFYVAVVASTVCPVVSGVVCCAGSFHYLKRSKVAPGSRQTRRFSPLLWGLSGFAVAFGQLVWAIPILVSHQMPPYPSLYNYIELIPYLCFLSAILLLPARGISLITRTRILLDALLIMVIVATLCYYFLLAPLLMNSHATLLAKTIGGLYSNLDMLAMFCVLVVALRSGEQVLRPVLIMLGIAAVIQFFVNVLHLSEILYRNYNETSLVSTLMVFYGVLLAVAAQTVNRIQRAGATVEASVLENSRLRSADPPWKTVLPSVLVLIFGLFIFLIWLDGGQIFPGQIRIVYAGGFVVLLLILLRQFLAMYQIDMLQKRLQKKNRSLDVLNAQLERQATTDPLTNLPNHRSLAEKLDEALAQARAQKSACSVIFMDIDYFKAMNDAYGHLLGDAVLRCFAQAVASMVRAGDVVGRWGGEEFVVVLPDTGPAVAFEVAERIRLAVSHRALARAGLPHLSCSLGVAAYPQHASGREELIGHADRAMYAAKRRGRDQTCMAHEAPAQATSTLTQETGNDDDAAIVGIAEALLALVKVRDAFLVQHARQVAELSLQLAQELHLSRAEARLVSLGGLLHDLGNIAMPDELLYGRAWANEEEREISVHYPVVGAHILLQMPRLRVIAEMVRAQGEWMDGSGYPDGLRGEAIPQGARIIAVADAYVTLSGERGTRSTRASILKELRKQSGSRFDPRVLAALERVSAVLPRPSRADVA